MEIVENIQTDTYRALYTARFEGVLYVLHCFQKKSKRRSKMTQQDVELLRRRYKVAEMDYQENYEEEQ